VPRTRAPGALLRRTALFLRLLMTRSFVLRIDPAIIIFVYHSLAELMNNYVFAYSKALKKIKISAKGNRSER
jgi:hypothetical protein